MKPPAITRAQLEALTQEEMIDLFMQTLERLHAEIDQLRTQIDELTPPPTTSRNSSQPPSRDQKPNRADARRPAKRGAHQGHARMTRALAEHPNQVIPVRASRCVCGADVSGVEAHRIVRRQVTELPEIQPVVIETQQHVVTCPGCGREVRPDLPPGLEAERAFGPRLEATTTYLQHQQHLSFERTQHTLRDLFGVDLSEGGLACIQERAGAAAQARVTDLQAKIRASAVVGSDETGARVDGRTAWEWVFCSTDAVLHVIRPSRGEEVITEVMGTACPSAWVSDCWAPQLRVRAHRHQLCLAHQIRNLQGLIDRCPRLRWAHQMQTLLREAIHLDHRRADLTPRGFQRRVTQIERRLTHLIDRPVRHPLAQALVKRYRKHRDHLLVFLHDPTVPFHNNDAERALRGSVVHRKVSGGFRSLWGAHAYAALASVIDTAKLHGQRIFEALLGLFGTPVLPFLTAQSP
jgi:transposase